VSCTSMPNFQWVRCLQTRKGATAKAKAAAATKKRGAADQAEDKPAADSPAKRAKTGADYQLRACCCKLSSCVAQLVHQAATVSVSPSGKDVQ